MCYNSLFDVILFVLSYHAIATPPRELLSRVYRQPE